MTDRADNPGARIAIADLCDAHEDKLRVLAPVFRDFGGRTAFHGRVVTVRCIEDNALLKAQIEQPGLVNGERRVLVVDGAASLRRAITGGNIAATAAANGWAGLVISGAVRDAHELRVADIGIRALALCPLRPAKARGGRRQRADFNRRAGDQPGRLSVCGWRRHNNRNRAAALISRETLAQGAECRTSGMTLALPRWSGVPACWQD